MARLAMKHDAIAGLIAKHKPVHYVDIPMHGNIGDLLIMQGTLAFLKNRGIAPRTIAAYFNFKPEWVKDGDVLLFHGGGNFGDLYPGPQQLRERAVRARPDSRIIILPQSIQFNSERVYDASCKLLSAHRDLHIFVRDKRSYDLARPMSPHVYLAPDMAHQLWPIQRQQQVPTHGRLGILRTDDESRQAFTPTGLDQITDWPALVGDKREAVTRNIHRGLRALHLAKIDRHIVTPASRLWIRRAAVLVQEAIDLYSQYDHITTDRLHGHLLACFMGIPNTLIDNSYGKNSSYAEQWTAGSDIVHIATTTERGPSSE
jgi:pyruvyl transferase EpsO